MRRTVIAWAAVGLVVAGACVSDDGEEAVDSRATTTTTTADGPSTSTTSTTISGSDSGGSEGDVALGDECDGEPPIWAVKGVRSPDGAESPGVDDEDEQHDHDSGDFDPADESVEPDDSDGSSGSSDSDSSSGSDDCTPVEEPELGTGDVQITLRWESDADIDLHVVEPSGEEISFSDRGPTSTGGQLDVDSNVGCRNTGSVENVFWPEGDMPLGEYTVTVVGFTVDGCGGGDYTLTATVQGEEVLNESGSVGEDEEDVYDFEA